MNASTHLAVGAFAGLTTVEYFSSGSSEFEKLFWAFIGGFVSHLFLDALPHEEYSVHGLKLGGVLLVEIVVTSVFLLSFVRSLSLKLIIISGMIGGAFPDAINLFRLYVVNIPSLRFLGNIVHVIHFRRGSFFHLTFSFYAQAVITAITILLVKFKTAS